MLTRRSRAGLNVYAETQRGPSAGMVERSPATVTKPVRALGAAVHDLTTERHEPDKPRGLRPDLWGTAGEIPAVYPAVKATIPLVRLRVQRPALMLTVRPTSGLSRTGLPLRSATSAKAITRCCRWRWPCPPDLGVLPPTAATDSNGHRSPDIIGRAGRGLVAGRRPCQTVRNELTEPGSQRVGDSSS